jgi:hypothetical protein
MANNFTYIMPQILAAGLLNLREQALFARLVNVDYGTQAAQKGQTIDIPLAPTYVATDVTPSPVHASVADSAPGLVQISLNSWKHVPFYLTDKEMAEIDEGRHFLPMAAAGAVHALANVVDQAISGTYTGVYGYVGTAATTPFASNITDATSVRRVLNEQLAPMDGRVIVIDPAAEANALGLPQLSDFDRTSDSAPRIQGELGTKLGFAWFMSQQLPTHTAGTAATIVTQASTAAGAASVPLSASTGGTLVIGDIISFAGDSQTYVVSATVTVSSGTATTIDPVLQTNVPAGTAVTKRATHTVNLAFTREAIAFANRPLRSDMELGNRITSATDPVSGISLRLEVSRQYKMVQWDYDILFGVKLVRPEFAVRLAG